MKRILIGMLAAVTLLAFGVSSGPGTGGVQASSPTPPTYYPLLSCPTVSGGGQVDLFGDIFGVAFKFGTDADDLPPGEPDGYHVLYDVGLADGTIDLFNDIFGVALRFGEICPAVDAQVAKATLWGIANLPVMENEAAIEAVGYYLGSSDVPGQGNHYVKIENWDGVFDPEAPEGLVYNNGKLAAQLYVVDGNDPDITWGSYAAGPCCPGAIHDIDLEGASPAPACSPACSWDGGEGWHLHYYLCTSGIGTSGAIAVPGFTASACDTFTGTQPLCTTPVTVQPCYRWGQNVGWMGHLWNHELNPNLIPDIGGNNGRFADCTPDGSTWKAFNCPG